MKTRHFTFQAGITAYRYEPYTLQNTLEYQGKYYVCGTGRQPILRNKMENDNYYLLTLAAITKEIQQRGEKRECAVNLGAGLPLAGFGREKKAFREYLLRSSQPVNFKFEGISYQVTIQDVRLFPQGYSAIAVHPELIRGEPSVLLMDVGGWTVDLMRLDNGIPNASTCRSLELGMKRRNRSAGRQACPLLTPRWNVCWQDKAAAWTRMPGLSFKNRGGFTQKPCCPQPWKQASI